MNSLDDKLTINDIRTALGGFRKQAHSLDGNRDQILAHAYEDAMERINGQKPGFRNLAIKVLSWITCAKRPLTTLELRHALSVKVGKYESDLGDFPQIEDMVARCAGLVVVDVESDIIRLVHYTTQEYFERSQTIWFPNAEAEITTTCVTLLSHHEFGNGFCQTHEDLEIRLRSNALYDYAACHWGHHARNVSIACQETIDFIQRTANVEASSQVLFGRGYWPVPRHTTCLHLAAYFGLDELVTLLLQRGHDSKPRDSEGRTPLSWAARNGHSGVVKILLATTDVNDVCDYSGRSPLSWAAGNGHEAIVKLLLSTGRVNPDSKDNYRRTPFSWAVERGHRAIAELLLRTGKVDAGLKDLTGRSPLFWAIASRDEATVRLILSAGNVDVNSRDLVNRTPLSYAPNTTITNLLRQMGAIA
jgi:ankyrin repeat protein